MRFALGLFAGVVSANFDFSNLVGKIQQTTLNFDQQVEDIKNREQDEIRNIELRERDLDRTLEQNAEKFHWKLSPSQSFLESKRRYKKHRVEVKPISTGADTHILEETEKQREIAEKNFLQVEKQIAELPEKLLHKAERQKAQLDVPLDDDGDDPDGTDGP